MSSVSGLRRALDPVVLALDAGMEPDGWQRDVLRSGSPRMLLNCSRQSGKSTVAGVLGAHKAAYSPGSLTLLLSPSQRQSAELFSKCKAALPTRPESESALRLELANGSRVISLPGTEKTVRGYSGVDLLIVDEAARVEDALVSAIRPMLAVSGGRLVMLSTPWGKRGVFFREWSEGVGWERYEITAHDCPRISAAFLAEERRTLGDRWYRQEYMCSFEETEDSVFASDAIAMAIDPTIAPLFGGVA